MIENKYINLLSIGLKDFVEQMLEKYSNEEKIKDSLGVCEWVVFILKNEKLYSESYYSQVTEILIAASFLHNINFDRKTNKWQDIFDIRNILFEEVDYNIVSSNVVELIVQAIESQLGKDVPITNLYPVPNSPAAHFALACSIYYKKGI